MNAKSFLIAHGEKLLVLAVAGGCGLVLWGSIDDPTIRPKEDQQAIEAKNAKIDKVFKSQNPPVMKEPRPYLDQLLGRVSESAPITPTMAWLTNPPDKGRGGPIIGQPPPTGLYLYVYELLTPVVGIEDAIGSLKITVAPPDSASAAARPRVSGEAERRWTRDDRGKVENVGRHLGIQVQIQVGEGGDWKPLALPGASKDGVLPLSAIPAGVVTIPTPEPWQRHTLRARLIAAATALDIDKPIPERPKQSVVVHAGPASAGPTEDTALLDKARVQVLAKQGDLFKALLRPESGPLVPGARLANDEKLFVGGWSDTKLPTASVQATASVRFALLGMSTAQLAEDPAKVRDVGRFLLLRLFEQGGERKWMDKPLEEKFGLGDVLGIKGKEIINPLDANKKQKIIVDLDTPFVIEKLVKDQSRVLWWLVKPVARAAPGRDRDLQLDKKEVPTEIVVLKNPETGRTLELTKLISVVPPTLRPGQLMFPHRNAAYIEKDEFVKAPSEFKQYGLVPEQPKAFKAGTGPLEELHKAKLAEGALDHHSYTTDTDYFVFADGRIAWWELITKEVKVHDPNGVMTVKEAAPAPAPAPTPEQPEAGPGAGPGTGPAPAPERQPKGRTPAGGKTPQPGMPPPGMEPPPGMAPPPGMQPR